MNRTEAQAKVSELSRIRYVLYNVLPDISYALSFVKIIPQSSFKGSIKVIKSNILVGEQFWDYDLRTKLGSIVHGFFHISLRHVDRVKRLGIKYFDIGNIASDLVVNNIIDRIVYTNNVSISLPKDTIHYRDLIEEEDLISKPFNNWSLEETIYYLYTKYVQEDEVINTFDSSMFNDSSDNSFDTQEEGESDYEDNDDLNEEDYGEDIIDDSDSPLDTDILNSSPSDGSINDETVKDEEIDSNDSNVSNRANNKSLLKDYDLGNDLEEDIKGINPYNTGEPEELDEELNEELWLDRLRRNSVTGQQPGKQSLDLPYFINELREEVKGKKSNRYLKVLRNYLINNLVNSPNQDWGRLSRRSLSNKGKGFITPGYRKEERIKHICIAVDRSGSTEDEIPFILKEVDSIRLSISCDITFIVFDERIKEETFIPFDDSKSLISLLEERDIKLSGGGGTSFIPVQKRMLELGSEINMIITDLYGSYLPESKWDNKKLLIWVKTEDSVDCEYGLSLLVN